MTIIGEYALQELLLEYSRQFSEALAEAESELSPLVEPTMVRKWLPKEGFSLIPHFFPPTGNTPEDQWYWAEEKRQHPALTKLLDVLQRFDDFATEYRNRVEFTQRPDINPKEPAP